jgi:hypothetical protein
MKQHKITAVLLALCTLLSVTACADRSSAEDQIESTAEHSADFTDSEDNGSRGDESKAEDSGEAAQTTVTQQTEAPQQTVTRTTVTLPPDEKPVLLKEMQSVKKDWNITSVVPAGGGLAAVENEGKCFLIDTASDKVTAEIPLQKSNEQLLGVNPAGTELITVTGGMDERQIYIYDIAGGRCTSLDYSGQNEQFFYDRDTDTLFGSNGSSVTKISRDGKETVLYQPGDPQTVSLISTLYRKGLIVENIPDDEYPDGLAVVRSLADGREAFRVENFSSGYHGSAEGLIRFETKFSSSKKQYVSNLAVLDWQTGKERLACGVCEGNYTSLTGDPESRYVLVKTLDQSSYAPDAVTLLDTQTGKTEKLSLEMKNAVNAEACYLPELGCWLCAVTACKDEKYSTRLYRIDPTQAKCGTEKKELYDIAAALPRDIGSALKNARVKADAIEKKYGIRVLIGNEVNRLTVGYIYISTEDPNYSGYDAEYNGKPIEDALDYLDKELARYPAGFFDNYRQQGKKGLRIALPAALVTAEHKSSQAAGCAFSDSLWENIALEWLELRDGCTALHHEIFHTVEDLLNAEDYYYFLEDWNRLNPADFSYDSNFTDARYLLLGGDNKSNAYFTRDYGATSGKEDRACIAEYCFSELDGVSGYQELQSYPHLKAKLDFMELRLRECFGKSYFSEIFA